ncbi:class I adenylate-forming enzyme family protein [Halorubrum trueperi]|uniref:Class I adenylate-forming enzyme family protein n=1 Tax=Halorubrum trueperi TaxID=2004704 RepID=A0ABD5UR45_9EURY
MFRDEDIRWTYAEFNEELNKMANAYLDLGLSKGDRVGFMGQNTSELIVSYIASMYIGLEPCFFNLRESKGRLQKLSQRFDPECFVYDERVEEKISYIRETVDLDTEISVNGSAGPNSVAFSDLESEYTSDPPDTQVSRGDVGLISWSSGTTGIPKGLVWSNEGVVFSGSICGNAYDLRSDDSMVNMFTPGFHGWVYFTFPAILNGAKLIFLEEYEPVPFLEAIEEERVSVFGGVPTPLRMALQQDIENYDFSSVRHGFFAGEKMDPNSIKTVNEHITTEFYSIYGTSEAAALSGQLADVYKEKPDCLGQGPPTVEARAVKLTEAGGKANPDEIVAPGESGELIISSPARAEYVLDDPEKTNEIFRDGWWYSGDAVRKDEDGDLFIVGRTDDMIISGGINVFPNPIEEAVTEVEGVVEAAVIGLPSEEWGEEVTAVVRSTNDVSESELEQYLRDHEDIPSHARPKAFYFWGSEEFPKTTSGKIYRSKIKEHIEGSNHDE